MREDSQAVRGQVDDGTGGAGRNFPALATLMTGQTALAGADESVPRRAKKMPPEGTMRALRRLR